jgi:hypothetical protein
MNALALQQRAMLRALWAPGYESAAAHVGPFLARADAKAVRGLRAYRTNGRMLAERALAAAYPTVVQTIGDENFAGLARAHWQRFPPASGDVGAWGGRLAGHIESIPQLLEDFPKLANEARIDWAMHCAATAPDAAPRLDTLKLLLECDPAQLTLRLAPGTACVAGTVVWRTGWEPRKRDALEAEAALLETLLARRSLLAAVECAPSLDLDAWLARAAAEGLVIGARRLRSLEKTP